MRDWSSLNKIGLPKKKRMSAKRRAAISKAQKERWAAKKAQVSIPLGAPIVDSVEETGNTSPLGWAANSGDHQLFLSGLFQQLKDEYLTSVGWTGGKEVQAVALAMYVALHEG